VDGTASISFHPCGAATGIGSLPYTDPLTALALIGEHLPEIPHWPQLPQRGSQEHFCHQFLQPLVESGLLCVDEDRRYLDASPPHLAEGLTRFYEWCLPAQSGDARLLSRFMPPTDAANGFYAFLEKVNSGGLTPGGYVKGQIAGPLSVGLALNDHQGRLAYYHDDLRDVLVRTLSLGARCQAAVLGQTGNTPIIFVDDPAISAWGPRLHLALQRETIISDLDAIFDAIQSQGALCGLHACQAIDWSMVFSTRIQILSVDAFRFGASLKAHVQSLQQFMARGGVVAWGIVPTVNNPFTVTVESLFQRLDELWTLLFGDNADRGMLVRQGMITPACGTGLLTRDQAERIYRLTAGLVRRLREGKGRQRRNLTVRRGAYQ
jgi:hypothetical protein